jgi:hypothetical protein
LGDSPQLNEAKGHEGDDQDHNEGKNIQPQAGGFNGLEKSGGSF